MKCGGRGVGSRGLRGAAVAALACAGLAACATPPMAGRGPVGSTPVPPTSQHADRGGPLRGTMKPYEVAGVWYRPRTGDGYDQTGTASWYGEAFHNHMTADGERFDMDVASAAHTTLPLPSIVEVTNLDNNRSIRVRLNDRGPFVGGRIIDLSRQAAKDLGFYGKGLAHVRVRWIGPAPLAGPDAGVRYAAAPAPPARVETGRSIGARVQAGAFSDPDNAERARQRLASEGEASVEPLQRGETRLWRVVVRCAAGQDAGDLRQRVAAAGFPDAKVLSAF